MAVKGALDYLVSKGVRRGLLGGETLWLVLGGTAFALRFAVRVMRKKQEVVFTEKLGVGETLTITHLPPRGKNGRREGPATKPKAGG